MGRVAEWVRFALGDVGDDPVAAAFREPAPIRGALGMGTSAGNLGTYSVDDRLLCGGISRDQAISVPAVKRARDLIVSIVSGLPIVQFREGRVDEDPRQIEPPVWGARPDPARTRQWVMAWTVDDAMFEGRAFWRVKSRTTAGFPEAFELMRFRHVSVSADGESLTWTDPARPGAGPVRVPARDVVEFLSPNDALVTAGARTVSIALSLDRSALRHASHDVPSGWLELEGEPPEWVEDLDGLQEYLDAIASAWHAARMSNTTGALPEGVKYRESSTNPEKMQLQNSRQYAAVEAARLTDVPGWFVGANAPGSSLTYQNAAQTHVDAIDFGAAPYIRMIEETLSGPNVSPAGHVIKLDPTDWLDVSTPALGGEAPASQEVPDHEHA